MPGLKERGFLFPQLRLFRVPHKAEMAALWPWDRKCSSSGEGMAGHRGRCRCRQEIVQGSRDSGSIPERAAPKTIAGSPFSAPDWAQESP